MNHYQNKKNIKKFIPNLRVAAIAFLILFASSYLPAQNKSDSGSSQGFKSSEGASPDQLRVIVLPVTEGDAKGARERTDAAAE